MEVGNEDPFVHHPPVHDDHDLHPPDQDLPQCFCGLTAFVKQSRHVLSSGRVFFCCSRRKGPGQGCDFYKWIDGHDKWDRPIMYFPYDPWKSYPLPLFVRWKAPPDDPPAMTALDKLLAFVERQQNPPNCYCGKPAYLQKPSKEGMFEPFFRCGQAEDTRKWDGIIVPKARCDFYECSYGPEPKWPTRKEVEEFVEGVKPWPCLSMPEVRCKCGIKANEGVVPSELGVGHYCGNAYGGPNELFKGKTCDWEDFPHRGEILAELNIDGRVHTPDLPEKMRLLRHSYRQRARFGRVPEMGMETWNTVVADYERVVSPRPKRKGWLRPHDPEALIQFWRENKARYDQMDKDRRNYHAHLHRQREKAEDRWRVEHGIEPKNLFPPSPPNDGHLPGPVTKEEESEDEGFVCNYDPDRKRVFHDSDYDYDNDPPSPPDWANLPY